MKMFRTHLLVCGGTGCKSSGSDEIIKALVMELDAKGLSDEVQVVETGCNGFCAQGPVMVVYPGKIFYQRLEPKDVPELVEEHILKGRPVERLMYREPTEEKPIPLMNERIASGV